MAYDVRLVQLNTNINGMSRANTAWGFPANTNFGTLLMSYWLCGPAGVGVWPLFNSAAFFAFVPGTNGITLSNQTIGSDGHFFQGSFVSPPAGVRAHLMLSVDTYAQTVQVYINDRPVPVTGGTWTGTPPFDFNVASTINIWAWDVSGVIATARFPALADVWISNPPAFVDLSVAANRRKFINADLSPVDLGDSGTAPFGYQPAMYMSVRPAGVATDILTNLGLGGGTWGYAQNPPTFQAPGSCTLPAPPSGDMMVILLPNAEVQFIDANGHPYAGGTLEMYVQGTSTFKDTWHGPDGGDNELNTNPIVLDSAGRAIVYGDGAYRTVLRDADGNLVWDQPSFTYISVALAPVVGAPTIAEAVRLLGIADMIAAEADARVAGDAAEAAARTAAIAAEAAARDAAIAVETSRAEAAEAALGGRIDGLPAPAKVQGGDGVTGADGHVRITFAAPFTSACTGFAVTTRGISGPIAQVAGEADRTGADCWATFPGTSTAASGAGFSWIATGD